MLHIHCGDSSATILRNILEQGKVITWTEILYQGQVSKNHSPNEYRLIRAEFLSRGTGDDRSIEDIFQNLIRQDKWLNTYNEYDEVVLWFDACLFDQTILMRQLHFFHEQKPLKPKLSLICIEEFPGVENFKGLGQLTPDQLISLLDSRHQVTARELELGSRAWEAFCDANPRILEGLLSENLSTLPFLKAALMRHLQQYPLVKNGLSHLETAIMESLDSSPKNLIQLFMEASSKESRPFFGDTTFFSLLAEISAELHPLINIHGPEPLTLWNLRSNPDSWMIEISEFGREVLHGKVDRIEKNGFNRWFGGIHLQGNQVAWRWDEKEEKLISFSGK